ncbi:MAG: HEPN domain-containing protein [Halobacteriota archaeon]
MDLIYINYVRSKSRVPYRVAVAIDKNRKRQGFEQLGGEKRPERDEKTEKMSEKTCRIFEIFKRGVNQNPHRIMDLLDLCATRDSSFKDELGDADTLTDYAVEIRYPDVWLEPGIEDAEEAFEIAKKVKEFIRNKIKHKKIK